MKKIIMVKIGGSLITDKTKSYTARLNIIEKVSAELKDIITNDTEHHYIIGNGAGSFAHTSASKYDIQGGLKREEQKYGFCKVHYDATNLHMIVYQALLRNKVNAFSLSPSSYMTLTDKKVNTIFTDVFTGLFDLNITPFIYGDVLYDSVQGHYIFSTETAFEALIGALPNSVEKIIHLTTVDGVYDESRNVVNSISASTYALIKKHFYTTEGYDVTGGMAHKIEKSLEYAKRGIKTYIINGSALENRLSHAITGKNLVGTIIT